VKRVRYTVFDKATNSVTHSQLFPLRVLGRLSKAFEGSVNDFSSEDLDTEVQKQTLGLTRSVVSKARSSQFDKRTVDKQGLLEHA
jgi:hypothetical protein